jgi:1,4-dihydroxy-2-naphthoyl-CoA hydrolase
MFISKNTVRMHDSDMAGIIFFANQFRFVHDAWEDFLHSEGISLSDLVQNSPYLFVIVHVEGDYFAALQVGDPLEVHFTVAHIGTSSFSCNYEIFRRGELVGTAKMVHVTVESKSRTKIAIPEKLKAILVKHVKTPS